MHDQETSHIASVPPGSPEETFEETPEDVDDLWDVRRAARFLGKSSSWVYRESEARRLPHRKIGRTLRYIPAELRAWVAKQPGQVI